MNVLFCGDLSPTPENHAQFACGDVDTLFADVQNLFRQADFSVVNLECAVTESETPIEKIGPPLSAPLGTAKTLKKLGVTHCNLSNNHFFDYGRRGAADSVRALDEAGIAYTGFGENEQDSCKDLVIEKDGETLCVIAVCEHEYSYALPNRLGCRGFDEFETPLQVRAAKEQYDRVVVLYHGGKEQCRYPSPRLRKACHAMAKSGADLILCQHSHCIGCYEEFEACHIVYGQGNFHFVTSRHSDDPGWFEGLAATYDTAENRVVFTPVVRGSETGIRLANEAERAAILDGFASRSDSLADGTWLHGWHAFCESKRQQYTTAIAQACAEGCTQRQIEKFAHYLDCEAHTDVWRELFQTYNHKNELN